MNEFHDILYPCTGGYSIAVQRSKVLMQTVRMNFEKMIQNDEARSKGPMFLGCPCQKCSETEIHGERKQVGVAMDRLRGHWRAGSGGKGGDGMFSDQSTALWP